MASKNNTPPIDATGTYVLLSPFAAVDGAIYRCQSIDGFEMLLENNVDVFKKYYEANGLSIDQYNDDELNGINIITLMSDNQATIYVPSSFIDKFPLTTNVPYSRVILSVDLGVLPDGLDLEGIMDFVNTAAADVIGAPDPVTQLFLIPSTDVISHSEHEMLENNRAARIVDRETPSAAVNRLDDKVEGLEARNDQLEQIIFDQQQQIDELEAEDNP